MSVATFPRVWPSTIQFVESDFVPFRRQAAGVFGGGRDVVVDRGIPQWTATLKTRKLFTDEVGTVKALRASLRGAARFILLSDPWRPYPAAYMPQGWGSLTRAGGGAFDGTATLTTIANSGLAGIGRDVITLGTLPASFKLINGDYVGLIQSGIYSLHQVLDVAQVTANGSGVATVWVEPEVPSQFTTSAVVNLLAPLGKFRIDPAKFTLPVDATGRNRPGQAAFTALSTLLTG